MTDFPDTWNCFNCKEPGHIAADCPQATDKPAAEERPKWCGECDLRTRLIDHGSYMKRCRRCWAWPAKGTRPHQLLPQHQRCGGCEDIIYAWDMMPCGAHQSLAITENGAWQPRTLLTESAKPGELAGAASAVAPSPSASSSASCAAGAGLTPPASSPNGDAPSERTP